MYFFYCEFVLCGSAIVVNKAEYIMPSVFRRCWLGIRRASGVYEKYRL